jgi:hypothetical protein
MTGHRGLHDDLERKIPDRSLKRVLHNSGDLTALYSQSDLKLVLSRQERQLRISAAHRLPSLWLILTPKKCLFAWSNNVQRSSVR